MGEGSEEDRVVAELVAKHDGGRQYSHSVIWGGLRFFTSAITIIYAASLTILSLDQFGVPDKVLAVMALFFVDVILCVLGRIVLVTESRYTLVDQWYVADHETSVTEV